MQPALPCSGPGRARDSEDSSSFFVTLRGTVDTLLDAASEPYVPPGRYLLLSRRPQQQLPPLRDFPDPPASELAFQDYLALQGALELLVLADVPGRVHGHEEQHGQQTVERAGPDGPGPAGQISLDCRSCKFPFCAPV